MIGYNPGDQGQFIEQLLCLHRVHFQTAQAENQLRTQRCYLVVQLQGLQMLRPQLNRIDRAVTLGIAGRVAVIFLVGAPTFGA